MTELHRNDPSEDSFDEFLSANLPEEASPEISSKVTPWTDALTLILLSLGLGLITFSSNGLLTVIQGTVCYALGLLGWNRLRGENESFRRGWVLQLVRTAWFVIDTLLKSTIWSNILGERLSSDLQLVLATVFALMMIVQLVCLRDGIAAVQKKAGAEANTSSIGFLIAAYVIMLVLALFSAGGTFISLILIVAVIAGLVGVARLSHSLDEAGYVITPSPARIPQRALLGIYFGILVLGSLIGILFFSSYRMEWQKPYPDLREQTPWTREHLLSMGFPETVLNDLSEKDILACSGAISIMHRESIYYSEGLEGLHLESVAVVLSENPRVWKVFYHFSLPDEEHYHGTDALELRPMQLFRSTEFTEEPHGLILTGLGADTIAAPIPSVNYGYYNQSGIDPLTLFSFGSGFSGEAYFASFSLPNGYQNARGYVTLTVRDPYPTIRVWNEEARAQIYDNYTFGLVYIHQTKR
ncbi:MAG: hypothetical protein IK035_00200, partial [Firmicutes bacterium]|nr:hypothetical protein [Bacillota bacterium]